MTNCTTPQTISTHRKCWLEMGFRHYIPLLVGPIHSPRGVKTLAAASWRWLAARLRTKKKDAGGDIASSSRGRPRTHSWE